MEELLIQVAKEVPSLVMMLLVVYLFIKYMKGRDEILSETLSHLGDDCHRTQDRSTIALDRNSKALLTNATTNAVATEILARAMKVMDEIERDRKLAKTG